MSEENTQENTQETPSVTEAVAPVQEEKKTETSATTPKPMMASRGARSPRTGAPQRTPSSGGARAPFRRVLQTKMEVQAQLVLVHSVEEVTEVQENHLKTDVQNLNKKFFQFEE